ncbi:unnamed protein product [Dimorphilus gyrociliatus]|uniref:Uncharacterized protein n=1 Tax=Dimorphilus gyrociliatus TaxID=2664684 RepID=A0A7I8W4X3_9ANNE|nr:unnamed protein product [Dimorphilus gyrociliatus]
MAKIPNPTTIRIIFFVFTIVIYSISPTLALDNKFQSNKQEGKEENVQSKKKLVEYKLAKDPRCSSDVVTFCSDSIVNNNYQVLDCLHDDKVLQSLSNDCHNLIWQYKKNLTQDIRFDHAMNNACKRTLKKVPECQSLERGKGLIIPCLIDNRLKLTEESDLECKKFLTKVSALVFTDFRLAKQYFDKCSSDIKKYRCGRVENSDVHEEGRPLLHKQSSTIECLYKTTEDNNKTLSKDCEHEVFRLAELQSDDYHLDRVLYYACKDDRERFCKELTSGEGKVYRCLFRHKMHEEMSIQCRKQLRKRQKLGMKDYKIRHGIAQKCKYDIRRLSCMKDAGKHTYQQVRLAHILQCLENALEEPEESLRPECLVEVRNLKRELLEDYSITPEIMLNCQSEIKGICKGLERNGKTLHCLMKASILNENHRGVNETCFEALKKLMDIARPNSDFKLDPLLHESCQSVAEKSCSDIQSSRGVYECLLYKIGTKDMTEVCEARLIEMEYFAQRNIRLQPTLYRVCYGDIKKLCNPSETSDLTPSHIFACLYQKRRGADEVEKLSPDCEHGIKKTMRLRALKVQLDPELEEYCIKDLSLHCGDKRGIGEEMNCLIEKYTFLSNTTCKEAIKERLADRMEDPLDLNQIFARACAPMVAKFCHDIVEEEIITCLIKHKTKEDMDEKCASGIEHHQILTLRDYRFSRKFKLSCSNSVQTICANIVKKNEVIHCLSEAIHKDTLLDKQQRVDKACRNQIKFEILSRSESIKLDARLQESCRMDIQKNCKGVKPGRGRVLRCLKKHIDNLMDNCYKYVFQQEKDESNIGEVADYNFMRACDGMIKFHCNNQRRNILKCLRRFKNEPDFDSECRNAILEKQEERSRYIELQPGLHKACQSDIKKLCSGILADKHTKDSMIGGMVMNCLRKNFRMKKLSRSCKDEVAVVIRQSAMDYKQDPILAKHCEVHIKQLCLEELSGDLDADGAVVNCLKKNFQNGNLQKVDPRDTNLCVQEVVRVLSESKIDIHFDPILYNACSEELRHHCPAVSRGEGRLLSCLLNVLNEKNENLADKCKKELESRKEMWELAAEPQVAQSLPEMAQHVSISPVRNQLMVFGLLIIGVIFLGGLFCGRVTKRVAQVAKDK